MFLKILLSLNVNSKLKFSFLILVLLSCLVYLIISIKNLYTQNNQILIKIELFNETLNSGYSNKNVSLFCLIKTHPKNLRINKTLMVFKIWAHKCDNYRFVSLLPKYLVPRNVKNKSQTLEIFDQFYMIQPEGHTFEDHDNLTLKVYNSIKYVYSKFPNYDWYHIVDDDAYVNISSFKQFLSNKNPKNLVTYGYNYKVKVENGFHSGGPGYVLSNEAFRRLGKTLSQDVNNCQNTGIDDLDVNACLRTLGVLMGNSLDEKGRERFLCLNLLDHFLGNYSTGHFEYSLNIPQKGYNCCADSLIAIHYMKPQDMIRFESAFELQKNILSFYKNSTGMNFPIEFKYIIRNYMLLKDFENDSDNSIKNRKT